jgi:uncharacterized protein involved in cysteine biosynthesis
MERTKIVQTVWRGEAVEDPVDARTAVEIAQRELARRRRMRPYVFVAAVLGFVIALVDAIEGTIGPAIALALLAGLCAFQWYRTPKMIERLEEAERRNSALLRDQPGVLAHGGEDL